MKARFGINMGIWIGVVTGIYALLYSLSPLAAGGVLPCSFIALPIYFNAGARKEEYFDYCTSAIIGVGWAAIYVYAMGAFGGLGMMPAAYSSALVITVITVVLCAIHIIVTPKGLFSSIPMMFGAIATTFFVGVDKWLYIMITLCLGITLGYVCGLRFKMVDENGHWIMPRRAPAA
jgi:hypothetical protein